MSHRLVLSAQWTLLLFSALFCASFAQGDDGEPELVDREDVVGVCEMASGILGAKVSSNLSFQNVRRMFMYATPAAGEAANALSSSTADLERARNALNLLNTHQVSDTARIFRAKAAVKEAEEAHDQVLESSSITLSRTEVVKRTVALAQDELSVVEKHVNTSIPILEAALKRARGTNSAEVKEALRDCKVKATRDISSETFRHLIHDVPDIEKGPVLRWNYVNILNSMRKLEMFFKLARVTRETAGRAAISAKVAAIQTNIAATNAEGEAWDLVAASKKHTKQAEPGTSSKNKWILPAETNNTNDTNHTDEPLPTNVAGSAYTTASSLSIPTAFILVSFLNSN
ncbi:hypothetical protein ERJ75_000321800 [Trypanosoma vivax]|uniref:Trypanosoma vivax n=1 Tax=Trypanosoma vivax (strain Y486) TaxID=1055687 RepID=G0UAA6_TRYVY|nr:Trypanosoma vivax [Trypanosoma vivax]KAH8617971.1 hypothetical protein ERJ75_000321800 [Trypanosoma vivax]CCC52739.1 Trypanosoma vivax [Trypanosoma vivax Y486]